MKTKFFCKTTVALLVIMCVFSTVLSVSAKNTYVVEADGKTKIPTPNSYEIVDTYTSFKDRTEVLKEPSDIFIDDKDNVYIADTGNNRIVMLDSQNNYIKSFYGSGFQGPQGVFVDSDGDVFVADTLNQRIEHLSPNDEPIEQFTKPETTLIDKNDSFSVSKIFVNSQGYIYVLSGKQFMLLDSNNEFKGFVGSNRLGFSLGRLLTRLFATDAQKQKLVDEEPVSYNNFMVASNDMIYAVTDSGDELIKKISPSGSSVFTKGFQLENVKLVENDILYFMPPVYSDIAVDDNGIITTLEQRSKRIYQYDQNGNMLTSFGGEGNKRGFFTRPVSIEVNSKGYIYVLDQGTGYVHVFKPTKFITTVQNAVCSFLDGEYEASEKYWKEIIDIDKNYPPANNGMGDCLYRTEKYAEAMEYYKLTDNKVGYGNAFSEYRYQIFQDNFILVMGIILALIIGCALIIKYLKKKSRALENGYYYEGKRLNGLHYVLLMLFHPINTFSIVKRERNGRFKFLFIGLIFFSTFIVNYSEAYVTNFQLTTKNTVNANMLLEIGMAVLPIVLWTISSYAMTSIIGGESSFKETLTANTYCLIPYIVFSAILSVASNVLSANEATIFNALRIIILTIVVILLFMVLLKLNDYSFGQAVKIAILSLLAMAILIAVLLLTISLSIQLYNFIVSLFKEINQKALF